MKIVEHKSGSYAPRTYHNANSADITVAIALDFNTAGERLTKKAATKRDYINFDLRHDPLECARVLYTKMLTNQYETINIAGNGVYTCSKYGYSQEDCNMWVLSLLEPIHRHLGIKAVVSGGQSGIDLAGGVAASVLDIPCTMTLPNGYKQRWEDGKDVNHSFEDISAQIESYTTLIKEKQGGVSYELN